MTAEGTAQARPEKPISLFPMADVVLPCPACGKVNEPDSRFCSTCAFRLVAEGVEGKRTADPLIGRVLGGRYRIREMLGRGGMGVVYKAEHVRMGKLMAIKLLHGELARERESLRRFQKEAEAVSKLDHLNTLQVFDFGQSDGLTYLVMELLVGRDLSSLLLGQGTVDFERAARIGLQVAASVGQAHERGIVHRDLKPENVFLVQSKAGDEDFVKVLDFGLAKLKQSEHAPMEDTVTQHGMIVGTPYYMAPEQISGGECDARTDIYALAAMLYRMITGVPPFVGTTPVAVLTKHLTDPVIPPTQRNPEVKIPSVADAILLKGLAKAPKDRYQSMHEFRCALADFLRDSGLSTQSGKAEAIANPEPVTKRLGRVAQAATRDDVDHFERNLKLRGRWISGSALLLLVSGLAWAGYAGRKLMQTEGPRDHEVEPNDGIDRAHPLPENFEVHGSIGRRVSTTRGDEDLFRIEIARASVLRAELSLLPNVDLALDVFRQGATTPISADGDRVGQREVLPNFRVLPGTYFLRVREHIEAGKYPTENISDEYTLRYSLQANTEALDQEFNDTLEQQRPLRNGIGYIGWRGDVDSYCLAPSGEAHRFSITPPAGMALSMVKDDALDPEPSVGIGNPVSGLCGAGQRCCVRIRAAEESVIRSGGDPYHIVVESVGPSVTR